MRPSAKLRFVPGSEGMGGDKAGQISTVTNYHRGRSPFFGLLVFRRLFPSPRYRLDVAKPSVYRIAPRAPALPSLEDPPASPPDDAVIARVRWG